ncbi:MAG: sigma 54-interacting transcriptional regulator [Bacillota bacterium]|nr:sigma 54-interacting transcriptional regulator [Bacillota bacterium]MDW7676810.1 sigma 54-interacting transcriptional regulator [Bacillota bacterium]
MLESQLFQYTVRKLVATNVLRLTPQNTLQEAVDSMLDLNIPEVLVMADSEDEIIGILTYKDVAEARRTGKSMTTPLSSCMKESVVTVQADTLITKAREILIENDVGRLPVYEHNKLLGIIRIEAILNSYYMHLENVNKQYMEIIDCMHEAVTVTDRYGKIRVWNKKAEKIYAIPALDLLDQKLEDYFPNALSLSVLENRIPIENVYHSPKPNYHVIISALPITIDGEFLGVVSTEQDVTEYKKLSSELENATTQINLLKEEMEKMKRGGFTLGNIQGKNPVIQNRILLARHVSRTNTSVLITGESGTGKEVFAKAIHDNSKRTGPFVPVNCSAIPPSLFESEFFGYVAGAFTGALRSGKVGFFELADKGTIFLDEIGDLAPELQAKLLRVLQENAVLRVGADKQVPVDVRVISATNRDLKKMVKEGTFREDLYYRLNVVEINLPPLRERREDIIVLFNHFLNVICRQNSIKVPRVDRQVYDMMLEYEWSGNIRELKNTVEYMVVLSDGQNLTSELVPTYMREMMATREGAQGKDVKMVQSLEHYERQMILEAMKKAGDNKARAAKMLGIPRSTLHYKLSKMGKNVEK